MPGEYEVGYGRPPRHTRFRKGESGNPSGRPRGTNNLKTDLRDELNERITVREGAMERHISKQRALIKSQIAQAIRGNPRAANIILNMILRVLEAEPEAYEELPLSAEEREILEILKRRVRRNVQAAKPEDQATAPARRRPRVRLNRKIDS